MSPARTETSAVKPSTVQSGVLESESGVLPAGRKAISAWSIRTARPTPKHAAGGGKHQAFHQQLPDQAPAAGAQGEPHRDLLLPRRCARDQQVGQVRAGDQQNQRDDRHQGQQRLGVRIAQFGPARRARHQFQVHLQELALHEGRGFGELLLLNLHFENLVEKRLQTGLRFFAGHSRA